MVARKKDGAADSQETTQVSVKSIPVELYNKIKTIAFEHGQTQNELYVMALEKFVELYEKKNGPVDTAPKKKEIRL